MSILHTIRDGIIFFFHYIGAARLYRFAVAKKGPLVRIVVFHDVPDREWFDSLMGTLTSTYNVLSPEDWKRKNLKTNVVNVLVTFDDGYASWEHIVQPILTKYGIKGIFFINSGLVDSAEDTSKTEMYMKEKLMISPRAPLTWDGVKLLQQYGHIIGSHTREHIDLTSLNAEEIAHEMQEDKDRIESVIGTQVTECAYPFGTSRHVNEVVENMTRETGFVRGYTAVSRFVLNENDFRIPRMCIENHATPASLKKWIEGSYDLFDMLKSVCAR